VRGMDTTSFPPGRTDPSNQVSTKPGALHFRGLRSATDQRPGMVVPESFRICPEPRWTLSSPAASLASTSGSRTV
jgi:hypothetical protein